MIGLVSDRDGIGQAGFSPVGDDEAVLDPIVDDPVAHAVSLTNFGDAERSGGTRWAGDAMLEPDPADHALREGFAGGACHPIPVELGRDLAVIVMNGEVCDTGNELGR